MQKSDGFEIPCSGTLTKHSFLSESTEDLEKIPLSEMVSVFAPFADCFGLGAN
jgi:hypothetical protein